MEPIRIKDNWSDTQRRFDDWFHHRHSGRPLMNVQVWRDANDRPFGIRPQVVYADAAERYLNADKAFEEVAAYYNRVRPLAEAFPSFSMNLGAGSLALYLGAQPVFREDTVWFEPCIHDYESALPLRYNPDNVWWKKHLALIRRQLELVRNTDILVCVPDLVENIDILAALRGPQTCCYDLYDYPDQLAEALEDIRCVYMTYFNEIYQLIKGAENRCAYTAFDILGTGKTAKIQCDFGALLSPAQFEEYIIPSLTRQCGELDNTMFHLDGPECLIHVDALMKLEKLGALQWTPGARNPRAGSEEWYPLYRKVKEAGKGLWIGLTDYEPEEAVFVAGTLASKFGPEGFYFHFPIMTEEQVGALRKKWEF